jgi:hypothetical protein
MKNLFSIMSLIILFNINGMAQTKNVNVDNYRFDVVCRTFPAKPWNPLFFYYSSAVNAPVVVQKNISIDEVNDAVYIEAQRKTQDPAEADMTLHLSLGSIVVKSSKVIDDVQSVKNKDGSVTKTHQYYVEVLYTFTSSYTITSKGKELSKGSLFSNTDYNPLRYYTDKYKTYKEAADFWNNNRDLIITDFYHDLCLRSAAQLSSAASSLYGFPINKGFVLIKTINEKKHNENESFRANADMLKSALQAMTPEIPMDREKAGALIEYFKGIPERYADQKQKADARLRYAAYYNLCRIYLFLDEPEMVYEYAGLILENGQDTKDSERLKKDADELKAALNKTEVKTRHFNPDDYFPE